MKLLQTEFSPGINSYLSRIEIGDAFYGAYHFSSSNGNGLYLNLKVTGFYFIAVKIF